MIIYDNKPLEHAPYLDGTVYIAEAGSELALKQSMMSIMEIARRPGDSLPQFGAGTKGVEVREGHIADFLASDHDFILMLDGDMQFPPDILERLRSHGLPFVSGYYTRRMADEVNHIWYEDDPLFRWPLVPFRGDVKPGHLYRLGGTGFGILLIHRSVFEAVRKLIKYESFCLQHDMAVWPYDLEEVQAGREQLRRLRGQHAGDVGADLRFCFYARQAGFTLWGDPLAACGHYVNYAMGIQDWRGTSAEQKAMRAAIIESTIEEVRREAVTA
jgi:hypothetical protein